MDRGKKDIMMNMCDIGAKGAKQNFSADAVRMAVTIALVTVAAFAVNFSVVPTAAAHPNHNCPAGQERPNWDGAPCVQEWGLPTLEWCRASGLTVRRMTADYDGGHQYRSRSDKHPNSVQLHRNFSESYQHTCYWKTERHTSVPFISSSDQERCSNSGYRIYVQQRTNNNFIGADNFDFFCMPSKTNQNSAGSNFDFNGARRGPHCVPGEETYRTDAHVCAKLPAVPINLSVRVVSPGNVEISWGIPNDDRVFADYYMVERKQDKDPRETVTTTFIPSAPDARTTTVTMEVPAHPRFQDNSTARNTGIHAFRVRSGTNDSSFLLNDGGAESDYSAAVEVNTHDYLEACVGAGWSADRDARTCLIPWQRASDGATGEFCRVSRNDAGEGPTCLDIFKVGQFDGDYSFPAKSDYAANDRIVYNCPHARSDNLLQCTCPANSDLLQKDSGGYECRARVNCDRQNRAQTDPYTCGDCLAGHDDVGGVCRERLNCADQNREQTDPYTCGACVSGHREFRGGAVCRPDQRLSVQDVDAHCPDGEALNAAGGAVVGRVCRESSAEDWCYVLDYEQAGADGALSSFHIGGDTAVNLPTNPMSCDNAYPLCGGENYGRANPFAGCECFDGFTQSNPANPDNICEKDCGALNRDAATGLLNCGACSAGYAEDVDGSGICHAVVDCATEQNRLQRNAYQCAGCKTGYVEDDAGTCREKITCPTGRIQLNAYECGECLAGFAPDESDTCQPTVNCAAQNKLEVNPYTCGACESGLPDDDGNCPDTPRADLCEASKGSDREKGKIMQFAVSLNSGECIPVQRCTIQTLHNNDPWECYVWSDTGRSEVFSTATVASVHSDISAEGECEGTGEGLTGGPDDRTCQIRWGADTRNFCESDMLRDPNNIFSECANDYAQGSCEEAGGEWKRTSHSIDPLRSERADTCILNGAGCYLNAGSNFDPDALVLYDFEHEHHSDDPNEMQVEYPAPLTGPCEDAYPNTCQLSTAGNAFLGCAPVSRPGAPRVSVEMSALGRAELEWEASEVAAASSATVRISSYSILRRETGGEAVVVGATTATTYTDADAPQEKKVQYQIRTEYAETSTATERLTLTSFFSEAVRIPGCADAGHSEVARPNEDPLCVPDEAHTQAQACTDAGWRVLYRKPLSPNGHVRCNIGVRDAQSGSESHCGILGNNPTMCSELFGSPPVFPTYAGSVRQYVVNCAEDRLPDPAYESQNSPRQECVCAEGYFEDGGQCNTCGSIGRKGVSGQPGVCAEGADSCTARATFNTETNVCDCTGSAGCLAPSEDVCAGLTPERFFDGAECVDVASCTAPAMLNRVTNVCECNAPNVGGTASDCRAPSEQVCDGLTPAKFFDGTACVDFTSCAAPMILDETTNVCKTPSTDTCAGLTPAKFFDEEETECVDFVSCTAPMIFDETTNVCKTPSTDTCAGLTPAKFFDEEETECVDFVSCTAPMIFDETTNVCKTPSTDTCAGLTPAKFFDVGEAECVDLVSCTPPMVPDMATNTCAAPSEQVCAAQTPPKFFDESTTTCIDFVSCDDASMTLDRATNACVEGPDNINLRLRIFLEGPLR